MLGAAHTADTGKADSCDWQELAYSKA